jgi:hypothetical protein
MKSVPSVARNGVIPSRPTRNALNSPTASPEARPARADSQTACPPSTRNTKARLEKSTAVPTERSTPPAATTSVIPMETIARSAKLLTRTLARFWAVGKVGIEIEKTITTAISAKRAE